MEIRMCEKGHFYDAEANATCPQCAAESGAGLGPTMPSGGGMDDYGATEPMGGFGGAASFTMPLTGDNGFKGGAAEAGAGLTDTMPLSGPDGFEGGNFGTAASGVEDYQDVTQPVTMGGMPGFSPVVGWLVCIEGPAKGADYRIQAGYNYIGRGENMDICIRGDLKIGRERHALIAYDFEERMFFFGPADGKSIVRLNGKMVMNPMEISDHDILTVGSTKLMFVPLCGERFNWDE